ncbi:hypothetical protein H1R20_g752, partial [Candolleomyces eurysporus]
MVVIASPPVRPSIDGGSICDKVVRDAVGLIQSSVHKIRAGCAKEDLAQIWHDVMISVVVLEDTLEGNQLSASARLDAVLWSSNGPTAALMPDSLEERMRAIHSGPKENKLKEYRRKYRTSSDPEYLNTLQGLARL